MEGVDTANEIIATLGRKLSSATTPKEASRYILRAADQLLGWDCAYVHFYAPKEKRVYRVLVIDLVNGKKVDFPINYSPLSLTPLMTRVITQGPQLILRKPQTRPPRDILPFGNLKRLSASILIVPIRNGQRVIGVLSLNSYTHHAYNRADLAALQSLADHCGGAFERINAQAALRTSEAQYRALAARLQTVREEESRRIARELHDEMGQAMTGLKIDLSWLEKRLAAEGAHRPLSARVRSMIKITDQTLRSVRRICAELRPSLLDDLGLVAAINWLARDFAARSGVRCQLNLPKKSWQLDNRVATVLFRAFQELLTNIARHARATKVTIKLSKNKKIIILEVTDNGRGIADNEATTSKSFGLMGIRERLIALDGDFYIEGLKNQGTTAIVKIPLAAKSRSKRFSL